MTSKRRKYILDKALTVNNLYVGEVIVDPHVDKHSDHITDELILELVKLLDGKTFPPVSAKDEFRYYVSRVLYEEKVYRLVWLQQNDHFYIGVITTFNEKGGKHDVP